MNDLHNMSISNGAGDWRQKEAQELSDIVQARIQYLQVGIMIPPPPRKIVI